MLPQTLAYEESSGHVRIVQSVDEPMRLLKRDGFVRVSMNENRGRSVGGDVRHRRELMQHPQHALRDHAESQGYE